MIFAKNKRQDIAKIIFLAWVFPPIPIEECVVISTNPVYNAYSEADSPQRTKEFQLENVDG